MPKQEGQKTKLLALLRILEQKTDEEHRLNVPQLVKMLEQQGIPCERKSVYRDIDTLKDLGYDIELCRGRGGGYWMASRSFDLSELKLLVDAVQANRAIPEKTTSRLIKKLEGLTSEYEGSQLQRQVYVGGRAKSANASLPYAVDALFTAINSDRMVRFRYKKEDRPNPYNVSPWQMAWENECYYLIAYQDEKAPANIRFYRVDRMTDVNVLDEEPRRGRELFQDFDLPAYLRKRFNMFNGVETRVTLCCDKKLEGAMRERFGPEPIFIEDDTEHFHFDTVVCVSDQFFGWVLGFGGMVEIAAPSELRSDFVQKLESLARAHQ